MTYYAIILSKDGVVMLKEKKVVKRDAISSILDEAKILLNTGHVTCCLIILLVLGAIFSGAAILPAIVPIVMGLLSILVKIKRIDDIVAENDFDIKITSGLTGLVLKLGQMEEGINLRSLGNPKGLRGKAEMVLSRLEKIISHPDHSVVSRKTRNTIEYDLILNSKEAVYSLFITVNVDDGRVEASWDTQSLTTGINDSSNVEMKSSAETLRLLVLMHFQLKNKERRLSGVSVA